MVKKEYRCKFCGVTGKENMMSQGGGRKSYCRCKKCHNKFSIERFVTNKKRAVDYKGGKCKVCGYDKCVDALEFHHRDPSEKNREYDANYMKKLDFEKVKLELDKCDLLCCRCHREIHADLGI